MQKLHKINWIYLFLILILVSCSSSNDIDQVNDSCTDIDSIGCDETATTNEEIAATNHPIILPGAPGEQSKKIDPVTATNIASTSYVMADVNFLQGMIMQISLKSGEYVAYI